MNDIIQLDTQLLIAVVVGIAILLELILHLKIPAFIALLISSIAVGIFAGMDPTVIVDNVIKGMGGTLGFVATVVGLGAMIGAILEASGGAQAMANYLLRLFGEKNSPIAMSITGFFIAIPVFFDVAFIILVPIIYALQRASGKSLLLYAIPLLSGLAITHAFIPPTPGPIAVADILGADLGWVILLGFLAGIPTLLVSGIIFGKYISKKIHVAAPELSNNTNVQKKADLPNIGLIFTIIAVPIVLILLNTFSKSGFIAQPTFVKWIALVGHPISALLIANILVWYLLGRLKGYEAKDLMNISSKSLNTAGTIILLTGAGGVFKQMLIETGAGKMLASQLTAAGVGIIFFAFIAAALIRVLQGSATVAMITGAGLVAPLIINSSISAPGLAAIVIAIASGASIFSHVNDSGFWLVGQYLSLNEKQTFRSWTVMTTLLALTGFTMAVLFFYLLG